MTASPQGDHVVQCPPSSAPHGGQGRRAGAAQDDDPDCKSICSCCCCLLFIAAAITGFVLLMVFVARPDPTDDPVYSVAVAGLDPARDAAGALSPVFNLTVHIDNTRNSRYDACVDGLSTAAVSYGDAPLARGSVPPFCAKAMREAEGAVARAWGRGASLPPFLREQLAGEAAVDVKVTMPASCYKCSDAVLDCSKVKIGGGYGRCRLDYVYPRHEAAAGSTG